MKDKTRLKTGVIGAVIAAICCFTPFLVVVLGAVGLSAWLGWLDYVLFPALYAALGLTALALYRIYGGRGPSPTAVIVAAVAVLSALVIWLEFRYALRISIGAAFAVAAYAIILRRNSSNLSEETT